MFNERHAARLVELQLDRRYFLEEPALDQEPLLQPLDRELTAAINERLATIPNEQLVKVLGAVHRSIHRHEAVGDSYLRFIDSMSGYDA